MTARGRALAILTGLAVFVAGWVVFVTDWSGPAGAGPDGRGAGVAGTRAADLDAFRNELLVWAPGGFSDKEVRRVRDSTRVAAISAVRTGTLAAASGRRGYRVVPVETMAVDTNAYTTATGRPGRKLATLLPKGAVLSKTGASLRRVKSGGKLKLDGNRTLRVSGVVDDALLGGYEVALETTLARRYGIQRVDDLGNAMAELERQRLGGLVDVADFRRRGGCWSPRLLRDGGGGKLSRHAW